MLFFLPHYLCRLLQIRLWVYLKEAFALPIAMCVPLVGILLGMQQWSYAHNYLHLAINMMAGLGVYGLGLLWAIRTRRIWSVGEIAAKVEPEEVALSLVETYQHEEA
jgi:hypothetical protein